MIHYTQCPLCRSEKIQKVITAIDHTVSQQVFGIWQCANCSLRFTQDVPGQEEIGRFYRSENYISHTDTNKGIINRLYHQVRKITLKSKRSLIQKTTGLQKGVLLDIGAGTGAFLHYMQQSGWNVSGVEPDQEAIAVAASKRGLNLLPSEAIFGLEAAQFDAITMWHVLEHVHQLHEYLAQLKILLKPGGKLFVAVPNYTSFDCAHYESHWAAYDVPRHLYHFSPASMKTLAEAHSMKIEALHPMWFDSFYVSLLSEKYKTGNPNLIKGFYIGLRSNGKAFSNSRRASSIVYVNKLKT
jgi:2-polyprenyl-3-methyl-5-hydroxy-6-metoxy-1,4-benzoquinol methylase